MNTTTRNNKDVPRLDDQFCFSLYACAKEVVRQYRKPLEELNLTYTQYLVMLVLWEYDGITEGELGRKVHLDSGTLSPLLRRLEKSGLINRVRPDYNERKLYVSLTDKGRNLQEKAKNIPEVIQNCIPIPQADLILLHKLLNQTLNGMERRKPSC